MWYYKLTINKDLIYHYETNELEEARNDLKELGGTLTDRAGHIIARSEKENDDKKRRVL